jgi:hypothetical protein
MSYAGKKMALASSGGLDASALAVGCPLLRGCDPFSNGVAMGGAESPVFTRQLRAPLPRGPVRALFAVP